MKTRLRLAAEAFYLMVPTSYFEWTTRGRSTVVAVHAQLVAALDAHEADLDDFDLRRVVAPFAAIDCTRDLEIEGPEIRELRAYLEGDMTSKLQLGVMVLDVPEIGAKLRLHVSNGRVLFVTIIDPGRGFSTPEAAPAVVPKEETWRDRKPLC